MQDIRAAVVDFSIIARRGKVVEPALTKALQTKRVVSLEQARVMTCVTPSVDLAMYVKEDIVDCMLIGQFQCFHNGSQIWSEITKIPFDFEIQLRPSQAPLADLFHKHRRDELMVGSWSFKLGIKVLKSQTLGQLQLEQVRYQLVGQLNWQVTPPMIKVAVGADGTLAQNIPNDIINREILINTEDV